MSDTAISINNVTKKFRRFNHPAWQAFGALGFTLSEKKYNDFIVLNNINININKGERVGLIGRNGAGKSTLLRVLSNNITVDHGSVKVFGKTQTLMELGTGFHPDFNGIQNIKSSLSYQGIIPQKINALIDEIIIFTELEDFIHRPIREYSAGMYMRLAFAVATTMAPEILIIDEILGAGDAYFVGKCFQRIKNLTAQGTTVLFVSHDMSSVQLLCERTILLEKGKIIADGESLSVIKTYMMSIREEERRSRGHTIAPKIDVHAQYENVQTPESVILTRSREMQPCDYYGDGPIKIIDFGFYDEFMNKEYSLRTAEKATALISYQAISPVFNPVAVIAIYRPDGICVLQVVSNIDKKELGVLNGRGKIVVYFSPLLLGPGDYIVSVALFKHLNITSKNEPDAYDLHDRFYKLKIIAPPEIGIVIGIVNQPAEWEIFT